VLLNEGADEFHVLCESLCIKIEIP